MLMVASCVEVGTPPPPHRDLNSADAALHKEGLKLLEHHLARMRKAGRLQDLPTLEQGDKPAQTRRRRRKLER